MAKIQVITALTLDGYLPPAGGQWMEWFRHDREGLPLWLSRCTFTLPPGYPLIDLMCELKSMSEGCTYVAEVTDAGQVELLRGLFLYRMVDELSTVLSLLSNERILFFRLSELKFLSAYLSVYYIVFHFVRA